MEVLGTTEYFERKDYGEDEYMACQNGWCLEVPLPLNEQPMMDDTTEYGSYNSIAK
jgi:hypothetical protein